MVNSKIAHADGLADLVVNEFDKGLSTNYLLRGLLKIQFPLIFSPREARRGTQARQANGME